MERSFPLCHSGKQIVRFRKPLHHSSTAAPKKAKKAQNSALCVNAPTSNLSPHHRPPWQICATNELQNRFPRLFILTIRFILKLLMTFLSQLENTVKERCTKVENTALFCCKNDRNFFCKKNQLTAFLSQNCQYICTLRTKCWIKSAGEDKPQVVLACIPPI